MACSGCKRTRQQLLAARTPAAAGRAVTAALGINLAKAREAWKALQAAREKPAAEKRDG